MKIVDEIIDLFQRRGDAAYHGEAVSQTEHALQSAALAEGQGAPDTLVVAALLHDIGHLLDGQDEDLAVNGIDGQHEEAGHAWLSQHFGPEVTEPIRLHVDAKRYLCAKNAAYLNGLSPASRLSLELQGGPMTPLERAQFETNPHFRDALRLRYWDDTAKVPRLEIPDFGHYRDRLEAAVREAVGLQIAARPVRPPAK
jgi:phosphonate degradation associated HDIG domain protein